MTLEQAYKELPGTWMFSILTLDKHSPIGYSKEEDMASNWDTNMFIYGDKEFLDVTKDKQYAEGKKKSLGALALSDEFPNGQKITEFAKAGLSAGEKEIVVAWRIR